MMAYNCPRCGEPVKRKGSNVAAAAGGAVGALLGSAFGSFECANCGKIPRKEFPPEARRKMVLSSVLMVVGAIALLIVVVWLLYILS
jgi:predicted RNA-binding Zn-ribbon protein involved in translation (DUF1610 family)